MGKSSNYYHPHPKDYERLCFHKNLSVNRGYPHPADGGGGYLIWLMGVPILPVGCPNPFQIDGGYPHPANGGVPLSC